MSDPEDDEDFDDWEDEWDRAVEEKTDWFEKYVLPRGSMARAPVYETGVCGFDPRRGNYRSRALPALSILADYSAPANRD